MRSKMVSLRFSSFSLVIVLFIFLTIKGTIAHSDGQAKQTFVVHEAENGYAMESLRNNHFSVEKEVLDVVPATSEFTNGRVGGRKMMIEKRNVKKNIKQAEAAEKADSKNSGASTTHSVGNLNHRGQGKLRVQSSKLSSRSSSSHSVKANTGSFVALNADYHMARPHPPKNN